MVALIKQEQMIVLVWSARCGGAADSIRVRLRLVGSPDDGDAGTASILQQDVELD